MNKKTQSAVEWLYNNLKSHFEHDGDLLEVVQFSFDKAKEMERKQIEDAFISGDETGTDNLSFNAKQYYNETFKKTS